MKKAKIVMLWILAILLAVSFVPTGLGKFTDPGWVEVFLSWGYPGAFAYVVGMLEILAGLALLLPRSAAWGSSTLVVIMSGALITHALHGNHPSFPAAQMAAIYWLLALILTWGRWPHRLGSPVAEG